MGKNTFNFQQPLSPTSRTAPLSGNNLSTTTWSPSPIREEISPLIGGVSRSDEGVVCVEFVSSPVKGRCPKGGGVCDRHKPTPVLPCQGGCITNYFIYSNSTSHLLKNLLVYFCLILYWKKISLFYNKNSKREIFFIY